MPTINEQYQAHAGNYSHGGNTPKWIVIHNTGNTASALNEAKYCQNDNHGSGYHYVLDGSGTIYHLVDDTSVAYAVGAWSGCTAYIKNNNSISIEVCNNGTAFSSAEISELAWLVPQLMKKYNIPDCNVVRHWDCHSGHKECPAYYSGKNNTEWVDLRAKITKVTSSVQTEGTHIQKSDGSNKQKWIFVPEANKDGYYRIKSKHNGLFLDVKDGSSVHATPVRVHTGNNTDAQLWRMDIQDKKNDQWCYLHSRLDDNKVLACYKGGKKAGTGTVIGTFDRANAQKWALVWAGESDTYFIYNLVSGLALAVD